MDTKLTYTITLSTADYAAIAEKYGIWQPQIIGPDNSMIANPETPQMWVEKYIDRLFGDLASVSTIKAIEAKAAAEKAALDATIQGQKDQIDAEKEKALAGIQTEIDAKLDVVVEPVPTLPVVAGSITKI